MSKSNNSINSKKGNEGKWTLSYSNSRSDRLRQLQEFRDDCDKHHQRFTGSEIGPYLKRRALPTMDVQVQPIVPIEADYADNPAEYRAARDVYEKDKNLWLLSCKNVESFKFECNKTHLPKLFVWIQERLDQSLRVRLESHSKWEEIEDANPRDPLKLMDLIEEVMSKGDISDVGYEKFESLKDLFSPAMLMKQGQSLTDFEKVVRGRMRFIQSKDCWKTEAVGENGAVVQKCMLDEEFFVNLMFDNLHKAFDNAKIDYMNDIASSAVERKTTFDTFVQYFSQILAHNGQHVATALATSKSKKTRGKNKDKKSTNSPDKYKSDGSDHPRRTRNCSHCDGAHWDSHCPKKSKTGKDNTKTGGPSSAEVTDAKDTVRQDQKTRFSADTLVTFGDVKMGDLTVDQIQEYAAYVASAQDRA